MLRTRKGPSVALGRLDIVRRSPSDDNVGRDASCRALAAFLDLAGLALPDFFAGFICEQIVPALRYFISVRNQP